MGKGKDKKNKKGSIAVLKEGFTTLNLLDNTNVYGVVFSECISNMFKEGMWQKVLSPYMLFLTNHDKGMIGNMITVNSTIRACVGVVAGRFLINRLGADSCFCIAGIIGVAGIIVNVYALAQGSVGVCFFLYAIWGVYTGLWNSCLEVTWARSLLRDYREDASASRQVLNKLTTAAGPLLSIVIFYWYGNTWSLPLIVHVMLIGTAFTALPVILCFRFDRIHEIRQEVPLCDIKSIVFEEQTIVPETWQRDSFIPREDSFIKLSYPMKSTSKYGKLRVFTPELRETDYIIGKQFRAWFKEMEDSYETTGILNFYDPSRDPVRVSFESCSLFLKNDGKINTTFSQMVFNLNPHFKKSRLTYGASRPVLKLFGKTQRELPFDVTPSAAREALLPSRISQDVVAADKKKKESKRYEPNLLKANVIVTCDVLNAIASGMSLKFIDLFLIETYGMSPGGVLLVQVMQNFASATLTPVAKQTMNFVRDYGFKSSFGVILIWAAGCFFMAVLCIPNVPVLVVVASIVLMNSLFSCTKAYNRSRLINSLPHDRVANYMVWDSLNKANQGGITILGAQLVVWGGYRACFLGTLFFLLLRWSLYTGYALHKGIRKKVKVTADVERCQSFHADPLLVVDANAIEAPPEDSKIDDVPDDDNFDKPFRDTLPDEAASELFHPLDYLPPDGHLDNGIDDDTYDGNEDTYDRCDTGPPTLPT